MRLFGVYLVLVIAYFLFSLASAKFNNLAYYERKMNPSKFVFWQGGEFFKNPPLFNSVMMDPHGQLSPQEPEGVEDVDLWVLLLDGYEDIKNVEIAPQLGIDVLKTASTPPGATIFLQGSSLKFRLHPIPFYVDRKHVVILNAKDFRDSYKPDCLDEIVYGWMIRQHDQDFTDQCEK